MGSHARAVDKRIKMLIEHLLFNAFECGSGLLFLLWGLNGASLPSTLERPIHHEVLFSSPSQVFGGGSVHTWIVPLP